MNREDLPDRKKACERGWRRDCLRRNMEFDPKGGGIPIKSGQYGAYKDAIEKLPDGRIVFAKELYLDDLVAFALTAAKSNPNIPLKCKIPLAEFVDAMDLRAVERHGFSNSPTALVVSGPSVVDQLFELEKSKAK